MSAPVSPARVAPWEDFVLRVIAIWKLVHAVFFTAVGFGLLKLRHHNVVDFLNDHLIVPYHINPESHVVDWMLEQAQKVSPHMLFLAGWASFFYAAIFATEGIGLYLRKRWAEWLVVFATGLFLPLEIYELVKKVVWWKFIILAGNLLIVGYLAHRILLDVRMKGGGGDGGGKGNDRLPPGPKDSPRAGVASANGASSHTR
jgi:uncharacterized membrane protein (DUF2068 family)